MKELETQLRSWAPRRPSARLKGRIFGRREPGAPLSFSLSWLAPATAALLVTFGLLHQRHFPALAEKPGVFAFATVLSNQSAVASLVTGSQSEQNNLPADAFQWSNGRQPAGYAPGGFLRVTN
jgi:hypothetical protein